LQSGKIFIGNSAPAEEFIEETEKIIFPEMQLISIGNYILNILYSGNVKYKGNKAFYHTFDPRFCIFLYYMKTHIK